MSPGVQTLIGILIPFIGTTAGAACVFLLRDEMRKTVEKSLLGFASGVMLAASVWSLLLPAINDSAHLGRLAFMPAALGTAAGMAFLLILDHVIPHLHMDAQEAEGTHAGQAKLSKTLMLSLAVTLHNIPEGMATGVVFASALQGHSGISMSGAYALALGIAIQNFPEGAVISMPLASAGKSKKKAFMIGTLSGAVEPAAAVLTIFLTQFISSLLPYLLSFAAGSMLYVIVEELIPAASEEPHSNHGTIGFAFGFILMMILDVALG
ncbi:MAG: ZIP family metal transporter [Eubacteriales bacterium]|nr:ZIP family metal transporter [Eubacteriales bacterium]